MLGINTQTDQPLSGINHLQSIRDILTTRIGTVLLCIKTSLAFVVALNDVDWLIWQQDPCSAWHGGSFLGDYNAVRPRLLRYAEGVLILLRCNCSPPLPSRPACCPSGPRMSVPYEDNRPNAPGLCRNGAPPRISAKFHSRPGAAPTHSARQSFKITGGASSYTSLIIAANSAVFSCISFSLPRASTFRRNKGSVLDERRLKRQVQKSMLRPSVRSIVCSNFL